METVGEGTGFGVGAGCAPRTASVSLFRRMAACSSQVLVGTVGGAGWGGGGVGAVGGTGLGGIGWGIDGVVGGLGVIPGFVPGT